MNVLGIDVGGSGIKGAVVDTTKGRLITPRIRFETPSPAEPTPVARTIAKVTKSFGWNGPIGVGFPGIIRDQTACSAVNLSDAWLGMNLAKRLHRSTKCPIHAINDADAAGVAEMAFGTGKGKRGTVLLLTLGTGIGSALFREGILVPNTEFGHLGFGDTTVEGFAAASVRKSAGLNWKRWGKRLNKVLLHLDFLMSPDLFILGGGVSKRYERIADQISEDLAVVPAKLLNEAGIIGAAYAASTNLKKRDLRVRSFTPPDAG